MTIQMWSDLSILEGGIELRASAKSATLKTDVAPLPTTNFASGGWTEYIGGARSGTVDMTLMQNMAAGSVDSVLWSQIGTADVARSFVSNSADGSVAYLMRGIPLSYTPIDGEANGLAMASLKGMSSTGPVIRGRLLHPGGTARTSSSTGTGRQLGAVTAGKSLYAALHVLSVSGTSTPTITVKVQSDDNGSFTTPTDRITFTGATAAGYQWGSVAGAITDDYWRISYTITGSGPSFLFAVTAGIV
jgi:hypothetical protein